MVILQKITLLLISLITCSEIGSPISYGNQVKEIQLTSKNVSLNENESHNVFKEKESQYSISNFSDSDHENDCFDYYFSNPEIFSNYVCGTLFGESQGTSSNFYPEFSPISNKDDLTFGTSKNSISLSDNRVTVPQTAKFRPGAIVEVDSLFDGFIQYGSGCFISDHLVLTAAHVVFNNDMPSTGKVGKTGICINMHGNDYSERYYANDVVIPYRYVSSSNSYYDWALLRFDDPIGGQYGHFATQTYSSISSTENSIFGYAGNQTVLYSSSSSGIHSENDYQYELYGYAEIGMSGGPVFKRVGNEVIVVGVTIAVKTYGQPISYGYTIIATKLNNTFSQMRYLLENNY